MAEKKRKERGEGKDKEGKNGNILKLYKERKEKGVNLLQRESAKDANKPRESSVSLV